MKKIWFIALISILLGAVSCSKEDDEKMTYTVTFDANGGSPVPSGQRIEAGSTATPPAVNPSKTGYVFTFWHIEGATTAYNFSSPINKDMILYAKWQEEATVEYWQVSWVLNGGAWPSGDNHATQVVKGGTLAEPNGPVKSGSTFDGWYKEAALTNKVNFPYDVSRVTGNFALYAKWKIDGGGETTEFTIRNTSEWNNAVSHIRSSGNNKSYTLTIEGNVSVPPSVGVEQGKPDTYTFGGGENLNITLKGSGTLALTGKGFLVCLSGTEKAKQKLVIDGPTLQGWSDNTVPLLRLDYADLELKNGKITKNINNGGDVTAGGGVYIRRGVFTMVGGEISNNTCGQSNYGGGYGGGVFLSYSTFNLSGGVICGNTSEQGGGVYFSEYDFTMTGGEIKGNTAKESSGLQSSFGGGVFVRFGTFKKSGGVICGSDANEPDRNKVIRSNGSISDSRGAAILCMIDDVINNSRHRESTLNEQDNINSTSDVGWEL